MLRVVEKDETVEDVIDGMDKSLISKIFLLETKEDIEVRMKKRILLYSALIKKYLGIFPERLECHIRPDKFVMFIYDEEGNEMKLKGNGEIQRLKSVLLHLTKLYVTENRKRGVQENITIFKLI